MKLMHEFVPADKDYYLKCSGDFYSSDAVLFAGKTENFDATFEECMKKGPYAKGFTVKDNGENIGYVLLSFTFSAEVGGMAVLIEEIYIEASHRGAGYGSRLLEEITEMYPGARRFRLEACRKNPRAVMLYERHGFKELDYLQMIKEL